MSLEKTHSMFRISATILILTAILAPASSELPPTKPSRILAVMPFSGRSHMNIYRPLLTELARRGHEIVAFSPFPIKDTKNVKNIHAKFVEDFLYKSDDFSMYDMKDMSMPVMMMMMINMGTQFCKLGLEMPEIQELISSDEKFDLIIFSAFLNECYLGLVQKFQAPYIILSPTHNTLMMNYGGNPKFYSYIPNLYLTYGDRMSFTQRLENTLTSVFIELMVSQLYVPEQEKLMMKHFGESTPTISEIQKNVSLVMLNTHVSLSYPKPNLPNVIEIGGIHLKPPKELPQDLKQFLDGAKDGAIYFSFGSNVRSDKMPAEKRQIFLDVFAQLPQRILWKWESDVLPGQPENVKIGKWLPQTDILAHHNVKVFISHGGLLSTQESLYHGICVLGIPFMGDQRLNIQKIETDGLGLQLNIDTLTRESLLATLKKLLEDSSYRNNAKKLSAVFKDQPQNALDRAAYWVEYVIRHKGAPHMRSAALDLAWYQYFLLDVIAVILLVLVVISTILYFVLKKLILFIRSMVCRKAKKSKKN